MALALGFSSLAVTARAQELPDGPGKPTVVRVCSTCHSTDTIQGRHQDKAAWTDTVFKMVDFGAETTRDERAEIVTYLAANFGPLKVTRPPTAAPAPTTAPDSETPPDAEAASVPAPAKSKSINVNEATAKDLESGLDLTQKEAEAIVRYRREHGPFKDWRDLGKAEGISRKKIEAVKDRLTFGESTPLPKP